MNDARLMEPEGPWFVNVTHLRVAGRPWCRSPVDYARVKWSKDWSDVDCAACHRERPSAESEES